MKILNSPVFSVQDANEWHKEWLAYDASCKSLVETNKFSSEVRKHVPEHALVLDSKGVWWVRVPRGPFQATCRVDALRIAEELNVQTDIYWDAINRSWRAL